MKCALCITTLWKKAYNITDFSKSHANSYCKTTTDWAQWAVIVISMLRQPLWDFWSMQVFKKNHPPLFHPACHNFCLAKLQYKPITNSRDIYESIGVNLMNLWISEKGFTSWIKVNWSIEHSCYYRVNKTSIWNSKNIYNSKTKHFWPHVGRPQIFLAKLGSKLTVPKAFWLHQWEVKEMQNLWVVPVWKISVLGIGHPVLKQLIA